MLRQPRLHFDVRDRFFARGIGTPRTATAAIATIPREVRAYRAGDHRARHNRQIPANNGVFAELHSEYALRQHRACEHEQTASFLVQTMHDPQRWQRFQRPIQSLCDRGMCEVVQRRVEFAASLGPFEFGRMANATDPRWLLDDDHVIVEMTNHQRIGNRVPRRTGRPYQQFDNLAFANAPCGIGTHRIADFHAAIFDERLHIAPRRLMQVQPRTQHFRKRMFGLGGNHSKRW